MSLHRGCHYIARTATRYGVQMSDWADEHLAIYLESGGVKGHILDLSEGGGRAFTTTCLIRYRGRTSGAVYVKPLVYGNFGGELVLVASKGGADVHPQWYNNIRASATVDVQVGTQAFEASWRELENEERHGAWTYMTHLYPPYITYQQSTSRRIPLVALAVGRSIDVFTQHSA
jgi:deazaflavin-dependent oxidoreductase (nitroreductase family)